MAEWRAVFCEFQKEAAALNGLQEVGVRCWYPYRIVRRYRPGRRSLRVRSAYFPGYLFADLEDISRPPAALARLDGVVTVLGETPVPDDIMGQLMALADADGLIIEPPLKPGDRVETGLPGLIAEVVGLDSRAATVLIRIFGRDMQTKIPAARLVC